MMGFDDDGFDDERDFCDGERDDGDSDGDDSDDSDDGAYHRALRAAGQEELAADRKAFGQKCKLMSDLLAVHRLPREWDDAKAWVRLFEHDKDPANAAAEWIEAGWTNPLAVQEVVLPGCSVAEAAEKLASIGATPQDACNLSGPFAFEEVSLLDLMSGSDVPIVRVGRGAAPVTDGSSK